MIKMASEKFVKSHETFHFSEIGVDFMYYFVNNKKNFFFRPIVLIPNRRVCLMLPALLLTLLTTATADPDANPIAKPKPRPRKLHNLFFRNF